MSKSKIIKHKKQQGSVIAKLKIGLNFVGRNAFIILFVIGSMAIGYALVRGKQFLNPVRNEDRYNESSAKLNYNKIDQKVLERIKLTQASKDNEVRQSLSPARSNPFSE